MLEVPGAGFLGIPVGLSDFSVDFSSSASFLVPGGLGFGAMVVDLLIAGFSPGALATT